MKKLFMIAFVVTVLAACTKKADEATNATPSYTHDPALIGTWCIAATHDTVWITDVKFMHNGYPLQPQNRLVTDYGCLDGQMHLIAPNGQSSAKYDYSISGNTLSLAWWSVDSYGKYQYAYPAVKYLKIK